MKNLQIFNLCQIGIVVKDIKKYLRIYNKIFGVKEPEIIESAPFEISKTEYRGKKTDAQVKMAFFDTKKGITIELLQPSEHKSIWKEFLIKKGEGVHHIAFEVKEMDKVIKFLEKNNMKLVQKGEYKGGRYAYIDATKKLGFIIELLENY